MAGQKWKIEELTVGKALEAVFWPNPQKDSKHKLRATHLDGKRAPKVVLSTDKRIVAGAPCMVRITAVNKPDRDDRGSIEVEYVGRAPFRIEGDLEQTNGPDFMCEPPTTEGDVVHMPVLTTDVDLMEPFGGHFYFKLLHPEAALAWALFS